MTYDDLIISPDASLEQAMSQMTQIKKGILFVCNERGVLKGVISDGDLRRALLQKSVLETIIKKVMNVNPINAETKEQASELVQKGNVIAVPVIDKERCLQSICVKTDQAIQYYDSNIQLKAKKLEAQDEVIAIIPARRDSKRFPGKNTAMVAGKELVSWALLTAKSSPEVTNVLVSTNDHDVKTIAESLGIVVPSLRPKELCEDATSTLDVLLYEFEKVSISHKEKAIGLLLEPTAPLRCQEDIREAVKLLQNSDADSVVSVCEVPHTIHPDELLNIDGGKLKPFDDNVTMDSRRLRGSQKPVYVQTGLIYAFRIESLLKNKSIYGKKAVPLITTWDRFLEIDTEDDLKIADKKMRYLQAVGKLNLE